MDLKQYARVVMNSGAVLYCRAVPPFAQAVVRRKMPEPPAPRVEVHSSAGGSEFHTALPGTPEYEEYVKARKEYKTELGLALQRFTVAYGTVAWELVPGEVAQTEPPDGWDIPQVLKEYGDVLLDGPDRRGQYILYELILTDKDLEAVEAIYFPEPPITKEDIAAAIAPFESSTKGDQSSTEPRQSLEKAAG